MKIIARFKLVSKLAAWMMFVTFAANDARAEGMQFSEAFNGGRCDQCSWIAAEGEINESSAEQLANLLASTEREHYAGREGWIFINSPGGSLKGGIELGRLIRRHGLKIMVADTTTLPASEDGLSVYSSMEISSSQGGICASACAIALMGGVIREVAEGSKVGLHQFTSMTNDLVYEQKSLSSAQSTVAMLISYAAEMGVSADIIALASKVPTDQVYWLKPSQMERARLVTTVGHPEETEWRLEAAGSTLFASNVQRQQSGRDLSFIVHCGSESSWLLSISIPLTEGTTERRSAELARSLLSIDVALGLEKDLTSGPYNFAANSHKQGILVTLSVPRDDLERLLGSNEPIYLDIAAPQGNYGAMGGFSYFLPRSNLPELLPHITRSCP